MFDSLHILHTFIEWQNKRVREERKTPRSIEDIENWKEKKNIVDNQLIRTIEFYFNFETLSETDMQEYALNKDKRLRHSVYDVGQTNVNVASANAAIYFMCINLCHVKCKEVPTNFSFFFFFVFIGIHFVSSSIVCFLTFVIVIVVSLCSRMARITR